MPIDRPVPFLEISPEGTLPKTCTAAGGDTTELTVNNRVVLITPPTGLAKTSILQLPNVGEAHVFGPFTLRLVAAPGAGSRVTVQDGGECPRAIAEHLTANGATLECAPLQLVAPRVMTQAKATSASAVTAWLNVTPSASAGSPR